MLELIWFKLSEGTAELFRLVCNATKATLLRKIDLTKIQQLVIYKISDAQMLLE